MSQTFLEVTFTPVSSLFFINHFKYLFTSMHGCVRQSFWLAQIFTAFFFKADKDQKYEESKQRTKTVKLRDSTKKTVYILRR